MTTFVSTLDNPSTGSPLVLYRIPSASAQVILSAPHGGSSKFGSQSSLLSRPLVPGVVTKSDLHTLDILALIDEYVRSRISTRPHIVAARFHRQFIDANRNARVPSQVAVNPDCVTSRQLYDEYHGHISNAIDHCIERDPHSRVLLLDLHGMKPYTDFIAVGSLNHTTHDSKITNKPYMGFLWHLRDLLGTTILPLPGNNDFPQYSGGFTIQRHGIGSRVDAFQLEFGSFLRQLEVRKNIAAVIGEAIVRTLQPMESFLLRLRSNPHVGWSMDGVTAVQSKLKKANCYTPQDLHTQLTSINGQLVAQGARKFSRGTLQAMREALLLYTSASSTSSSSAVESNQHHDHIETNTGKGGNDANGGTSNTKILPREFLELHYARLWTPMGVVGVGHETLTGSSRIGVEEGDSVGLRSIVRRIFLCPELLHLVLGRPQSEATSVQSFLEQACQSSGATANHHWDNNNNNNKGYQQQTGPMTMSSSQMPYKGGTNHPRCDDQNHDDNNNNYNKSISDNSALLPAFWAEFFRGLSFSCTPAVCPGFDRNCHLQMPTPPLSIPPGSTTTASSTTTATRDNVHLASLEGFAVCFADASEFNQKLRAWQAFVISNHAPSHSQSLSQSLIGRGEVGVTEGSGTGMPSASMVQWGTAAALSLPVPSSASPYNKPQTLRQQQQQQQQQSVLVDVNAVDNLPPPPPKTNTNSVPTTMSLSLSGGEDTLYQLVVFYVTCNRDN